MRRIMLLALLAVALPTAALANFVPIVWDSGPITVPPSRGTISRGAAGGLINGGQAIILGGMPPVSGFEIALTNVTFTGGNTGPCGPMGGTCTILGGNVRVLTPNLLTVLFTGTLDGGTITKSAGEADYDAHIAPNPVTAPFGGFVDMDALFTASPASDTLLPGSRAVAALVPEPATLFLLGTGVIGLAGMARRRFKLGR